MLRYSSAALVAGLSLFGSGAFAASGWHAVQEHGGAGKAAKADLYYGHHHLRVETENEPTVMIIELPTGDLTLLDEAKKAYAQASLQELVKMREDMRAKMLERVKDMPEEVRKNVEKMLEQQEKARKAPLTVKKTKAKDEVRGIACTYYEYTGGETSGRSCIADDLPVNIAAFQKDAKALAKILEKTGAGSAAATNVELLQLAEHGFPVKTERTMKLGPKEVTATSTLQKIEKKDLPKSKFSVPKGFEKKTFEQFMQLGSPSLR